MRFKEYLIEEKDLSLEDAVNIYLEQCSKELPKAKLFRKSTRGGNGLRFRSTEKVSRTSIGGSQLVQQFMESSPLWKDYPKRSNSIFCSTSNEEAEDFDGDLYVIYPVKNTKLAVCEDNDFNYINVKVNGNMVRMYRLNTMLEDDPEDIKDFITPENLGISLMSSNDINTFRLSNAQEVWFSGKYLSVNMNVFEDFYDEVKARK